MKNKAFAGQYAHENEGFNIHCANSISSNEKVWEHRQVCIVIGCTALMNLCENEEHHRCSSTPSKARI
jgi:hypothetical protein